jgi:hypothetical protein
VASHLLVAYLQPVVSRYTDWATRRTGWYGVYVVFTRLWRRNRQCSETSAFELQTPGNPPKESIQHSEQGESLKSRTCLFSVLFVIRFLSSGFCHHTFPVLFFLRCYC